MIVPFPMSPPIFCRLCCALRGSRQASADGHERNEPGSPVHLLLQGAYLDPDALGQGGYAPELGAHPSRVDHGLGLASCHQRAPEYKVIGLQG